MARKDYTFEYPDRIEDYDEAQMIANNVCAFIGLEFVRVGYGFGDWGNCYTYQVDGSKEPFILLNSGGMTIGTLSHELAHHFEHSYNGETTHNKFHKLALRIIQIYIKYYLRG